MKTPRSIGDGHWVRKGMVGFTRKRWRGAVIRSLLTTCICLVGMIPVGAQEAECDDTPPPNAPIPADLLTYCADHLEFTCDLGVNSWDQISHHSPDIRIGDTFSTTTPERPRFFFDQAGDRFYTKLYSRLYNLGGAPAPATQVTVDFSYKVTADPADWDNITIPWQSIGSYDMNIPAPATYGVLWNTHSPHEQQKGICWHMLAGQQEFPKQFILRTEINWSEEQLATGSVLPPESIEDKNTAYSFFTI